MHNSFLTTSQPNPVENTQIVALNDPSLPSPGAWLNGGGYSPVEIILAISVLIGSLGGLIRVLVPVMMHSSGVSTTPSRSEKPSTVE